MIIHHQIVFYFLSKNDTDALLHSYMSDMTYKNFPSKNDTDALLHSNMSDMTHYGLFRLVKIKRVWKRICFKSRDEIKFVSLNELKDIPLA